METPIRFTNVLREWAEVFMRRSMNDFMRFTKNAGLSMSQLSTLMQLYYQGDCGVSDIADHLGVTNAAASQMVERMVQQGLLERSEDPHDRRAKQLQLTLSGRKLILESIEARRRWLEELTTALTQEEQESIIYALTILTNTSRQIEQQRLQPTTNMQF